MKRPVAYTLALAFLSVVSLLNTIPAARSQEVTANIVGTVTDPSGAPIKGAAVETTDVDRGTVWKTETNDSGSYNVLRLPIGNYTVKISAAGFQTAVQA